MILRKQKSRRKIKSLEKLVWLSIIVYKIGKLKIMIKILKLLLFILKVLLLMVGVFGKILVAIVMGNYCELFVRMMILKWWC